MAVNSSRAVIDLMRRINRLEATGHQSDADALRRGLVHTCVRRTYAPNLKLAVLKRVK